MFFRRFVLNQRFCSYFATLRALTRSVYQGSTRDHCLFLSFFYFSFSLFVIWLHVVEGRTDIVIRSVACMHLYLRTPRPRLTSSSNASSSFEKVNEVKASSRPLREISAPFSGQRSYPIVLWFTSASASGILNQVSGEFSPVPPASTLVTFNN